MLLDNRFIIADYVSWTNDLSSAGSCKTRNYRSTEEDKSRLRTLFCDCTNFTYILTTKSQFVPFLDLRQRQKLL